MTVRIALLSLPSTTVMMSLIDSWKKSSLLMVPVTGVVVPIVYPVPEARVKATVSFGSTVVSGVGSTITVAVVALAAKVTVLLVPVRV